MLLSSASALRGRRDQLSANSLSTNCGGHLCSHRYKRLEMGAVSSRLFFSTGAINFILTLSTVVSISLIEETDHQRNDSTYRSNSIFFTGDIRLSEPY